MFKRVKEKANNSSKANFLIGLLTGIAVISTLAFFALLVVFLGGKDEGKVADAGPQAQAEEEADNAQEPPTEEPEAAEMPPVTSKDHIKGAEDAEITLVVYDDFECPFCLKHEATLNRILDEYEGKVRLVYRHFPLSFHTHAQKAAEASECAAEQGKFWEMHEAIYQANEDGDMGVEKWKQAAQNLGLNTSQFNDCLDSGKYASEIAAEMQAGAKAGVKGTPGNFVNGQLVSGALPYENFQQIFDSMLE